MSERMKKSRIALNALVVLALVLSFMAMPASLQPQESAQASVQAQEPAQTQDDPVQVDVHIMDMVVNATENGNNGWSGPAVEVCTDFYVNATVANVSGSALQDVDVSIAWDPASGVELLEEMEGPATQTIADLPAGEVGDVWWKFHCTEPGMVEFDVTSEGVTDSAAVMQFSEQEPQEPDVLRIELIEYPGYGGAPSPVNPSENFAVKALVHNDSDASVEDVVVSIENMPIIDTDDDGIPDQRGDAEPLDGNHNPQPDKTKASFNVGSIAPGQAEEVGFTWHCTGPINPWFFLDADFAGEEGSQVTSAEVEVRQFGTEIEVELSSGRGKLCDTCNENTTTVTATVENTLDDVAENVHVTLDKVGDVDVAGDLTKNLGDIAVGASETATWDVTCTGDTDAEFTATATADNADDAMDELTIVQKNFMVEITEPAEGDVKSSEQVFPVKATIYNCQDNNVSVDEATIDLSGLDAELAPDTKVLIEPGWGKDPWEVDAAETVDVGSICSCCSVDVTWMVKCTGTGDGPISVSASSVGGTYADEDTVEIEQEWKAHLMAGIEVFPGHLWDGSLNPMPVDAVANGDPFTAVVVVANTGEAVAESVVMTRTVEGPTSCEGTESVRLGDIEPGESVKYPWYCWCNDDEKVTISVSGMEGIDENTDEPILKDNIDEPCPKTVEQKNIVVDIVQPDEDDGDEFYVSDDFTVKVYVANESGQDIEDVSAHLVFDESLVEYKEPMLEQMVSTQPFTDDKLVDGSEHELTWQMHCIAEGETDFLFKLISQEPRMKVERMTSVTQTVPPPEGVEPGECTGDVTTTVSLTPTWNLVSLPIIPADPAIETVLWGSDVDKAAHYTGGPAGTWLNYNADAPSDLTEMVDGKGYWVSTDITGTLDLCGYEGAPPPPAVPPSYDLLEGWNMVGVTSMDPITATDYLAGVEDDLMGIYGYDADNGVYTVIDPTADNLEPGQGYWVALSAPGTIYP